MSTSAHSAAAPSTLGVLAFGDSITNGGGELQWGVAMQSWALWLARALGLPYTGYAVDGARVDDVLTAQIPDFLARTADPGARYTLGCLYVGVNDVRALDWEAAGFERGYGAALSFIAQRADRVLTVTAPQGLGIPRVPAPRIEALNAAIERQAAAAGALLLDLREFGARNLVMADRVHPTAFGQIAIAERALPLLERDGVAVKVRPSRLIVYETTRWKRLRGDATYAYRSAKERVSATRDGLLLRLPPAAAQRIRG